MRPATISWDDVELLPGDQPMRLKVPGDKIAELHPADLAEIITDLSRAESSQFLESLDVKTVADTLEEVEPDFQAGLVEVMPDESVGLLDSQDKVAQVVAKYDLLAVPVVDKGGRLRASSRWMTRWTRLSRPNGRNACPICTIEALR